MKIIVVRHGETDVNLQNLINGQNDSELNKTGIKQAEDLKSKINLNEVDYIYSSNLMRAYQTADIICEGKREIILDPRLRERNMGKYTKKLISSIDQHDWWSINPKIHHNTGETVKEVMLRFELFMQELKETYKNKTILLVTHGGMSKVINAYFNAIPSSGTVYDFHMDNCEKVEFII